MSADDIVVADAICDFMASCAQTAADMQAEDEITVEVDPGIDDYLADDRIDRWLGQCARVRALAVVADSVLAEATP